ncbi:Hypothetical protein PHPALM_5755 [Phytophthora palmivora]|uniref:Integrase zinc-binding domain-containing protein n=1 Tax=Phytophthora palmivora TaxID=4796 RepID=A0A2P4YGV1_9STRA|nr:Hypothetical protein PHPALM_5755 [Phytophthora palmivora]
MNSVKYLHVIRLYNSAADSMATEALETQINRVVLGAERKAELKTLNWIPETLYATGDSTDECEEGLKAWPITRSQLSDDEALTEPKMKSYAYLSGELSQLSFRRVRNASKMPDDFVLSENGLLCRQNRSRRRGGDDEPSLDIRLVVPTTMVDEVLQNCHNSVEGGHQGIVRTYHRVKSHYYWIGLYTDVVRHGQSFEDCCTSKSKPHLRGITLVTSYQTDHSILCRWTL